MRETAIASALAVELVRLKVDVLLRAVREIHAQPRRRPPRFHRHDQAGDPVGGGFVASLARPGGNITGLVQPSPGAKRQTTGASEGDRSQPLSRGRLPEFTQPDHAQVLKELDLAAGQLGVKLQYLEIRSPKDFETAFQAARQGPG